MEFDDEKQQNIKFTFAKFVNAEFFNKLSQPVKNIHYLTNTKNNNITH
jgi:hypothetical protein